MRQDFHKVVIERPRSGRGIAPYYKRVERRILNSFDEEDWIDQSSINSKRYRKERKDLSDLLGPLKRYLRKAVGRPWNDVYSEIVKGLPSGMHRDHILSHVLQMVEINTAFLEGKIVGSAHSRFWSMRGKDVEGLFVHPGTGKLAYNQPVPRNYSKSLAALINLPAEKREIIVQLPSELEYIPFSNINPSLLYKAPLIDKKKKISVRRYLKKEYLLQRTRGMIRKTEYIWNLYENWTVPHFSEFTFDPETSEVTEYKFRGMKEISIVGAVSEADYGKYGLQIPVG